jgi:MoxR-like ATPase
MFEVYSGGKAKRPASAPHSAGAQRRSLIDPSGYRADPGLADAVNVAILLGQPLLLTGEPGTGKTQLAFSLAWELDLGEPFVFETKSTSTSRDLFYTFDSLGRFSAVQTGAGGRRAVEFITYNALGAAIVRANEGRAVAEVLPADFPHDGPRRSVVLIDEVDKAPRDFPNDILNELDRLYFKIPELNNARVEARPEYTPLVVITSNSERNLPDAFLRRCIYYDVQFPDTERLAEIVEVRLGHYVRGTSPLLAEALGFFNWLRSNDNALRKRPGTAELLDWLSALAAIGASPDRGLRAQQELALRTVAALLKTAEDQRRGGELFTRWQQA